MIKTKQELLNHFSDINEMYNNPFKYQTLSNMIDELLEQRTSEDCISREAVKKLKKYRFNYDTNTTIPKTDIFVKIADIEELPPVTSKTRWIPVSKRLPDRDVDVLTYHRNESFDYQYVSWIDESTGKWAGFIGNLHDEVIAWMPLPEPYKAGSEEA